MNGGTLDTKIRIESPTVAPGDLGDPVTTWTTLAGPWAEVRYLRGRELIDAQQRVAEVDTKFIVRYSSSLMGLPTTAQIVIAATGKAFDILEALPVPGGRPEKIEFLAKRRADQ